MGHDPYPMNPMNGRPYPQQNSTLYNWNVWWFDHTLYTSILQQSHICYRVAAILRLISPLPVGTNTLLPKNSDLSQILESEKPPGWLANQRSVNHKASGILTDSDFRSENVFDINQAATLYIAIHLPSTRYTYRVFAKLSSSRVFIHSIPVSDNHSGWLPLHPQLVVCYIGIRLAWP